MTPVKDMDEKSPSGKSKTDWDRLAVMGDDDIDTSDIPEADDKFFERAELRIPRYTGKHAREDIYFDHD